ncbi:MAG: cell wall-binding repeat-containing protein [Clostridiaceae bacterium]
MTLRKKLLLFLFCFFAVLHMRDIKAFAAPTVERFGGKDRYETSIQVSKNHWEVSNYIILVSGEDFPDALSAAPLSKKYDAPILLTKNSSMSKEMMEEIKRLNAKNAFIISGPGVISENVEKQLKDMGLESTRIYGADRYETSVKVAEVLGTYNDIFIASGENFPDAVSAAPMAAIKGAPILLTRSKNIPDSVGKFINANKGSNYYIIGGEASIQSESIKNIENFKRLSGQDRYKTNEAVINEFLNQITFDKTYIANGLAFADALSGSAAAAKTLSPVMLVGDSYDLKKTLLTSKLDSISTMKVLGGTGVISDVLLNKILNGGSIKVVLDPGHGGYDSGAVGPTKKLEKDVTLAITLKVGEILKSNGIDVVYTRSSDKVSWPSNEAEDLKKRVEIANNENIEYFVSIHANSAPIPGAHGTETYYSPGSVQGQKLAGAIQGQLVNAIGLTDRGVKPANFYVLNHTKAPAALVEVAFISNANEEKLLVSNDFQNKAAKGIAEGILKSIRK